MSASEQRGLLPAVALLSAATTAYEILLVRLFGVEQFHHFATMVIGVALLGLGASGTLGALRPPKDSRAAGFRLRVAATHDNRAQAERVAREVMALYTCGPAGGGGVRTALTPRLNTISCLLPRESVPVRHERIEEAA